MEEDVVQLNGNIPSFNESQEELSTNSSSSQRNKRRTFLFCKPSINLLRKGRISTETSEEEQELNNLLEEAISEK